MSAQEIIAELANLTWPELESVDARLHELLESRDKGLFELGEYHRLLKESQAPAAASQAVGNATAGALLAYLDAHCLGVPGITPERRHELRTGRGRRSPRRSLGAANTT